MKMDELQKAIEDITYENKKFRKPHSKLYGQTERRQSPICAGRWRVRALRGTNWRRDISCIFMPYTCWENFRTRRAFRSSYGWYPCRRRLWSICWETA